MQKKEILEYMREGAETYFAINPNQVYRIGRLIGRQVKKGKKVLIMGNGGSSLDAQHIATELVCMFEKRRKALPAIALTSSMSSITATGNDFGYENVFDRQVEAFAKSGDVVIAISTSGNSANILKAIAKANKMGCITVAMTGKSGGKLNGLAKHVIRIESDRTSIIQESHLILGHLLSKIIEDMIAE
jgi:D-sedoheptulose 7-phosphate isomerase